jgi:[ribosomal protein S5]-alanine N-acetyltransferase
MAHPDLPPFPAEPVAYGPVVLRELTDLDVPMVQELSADPYIPLIGSIPANASRQEATDWIDRQRVHQTDGTRLSFAIAEAGTGRAVGTIGLGLAALASGRATAGYSVAPSARGRGVATAALIALTGFAWTIPALYRIELHIEPWNTGSIRAAERAGYEREGLLRSHQEIGGQRRDMLLYAIIRPQPRSSEP